MAWPKLLSPQQLALPLAVTPQVWKLPALIAVNNPGGGVAWPALFLPQQEAPALFVMAHVWKPPALIAVTAPTPSVGGGVAWPKLLSPQHAALPSPLMPQVWKSPAAIAANPPAGGLAWPSGLAPQQARDPLVSIAHEKLSPELTLPATASGGATAIDPPSLAIGGAAASAGDASPKTAKATARKMFATRDTEIPPFPRSAAPR